MHNAIENIFNHYLKHSSIDCISGFKYVEQNKDIHNPLKDILGDWRYGAIINAFLHKGSRELNAYLQNTDPSDDLLNPMIDFSFLLNKSLSRLKSTTSKKLIIYKSSCSPKTENVWINSKIDTLITSEQFLKSSHTPVSGPRDFIKIVITPLKKGSRAYNVTQVRNIINPEIKDSIAIYSPNTTFQITDIDVNGRFKKILHLYELNRY